MAKFSCVLYRSVEFLHCFSRIFVRIPVSSFKDLHMRYLSCVLKHLYAKKCYCENIIRLTALVCIQACVERIKSTTSARSIKLWSSAQLQPSCQIQFVRGMTKNYYLAFSSTTLRPCAFKALFLFVFKRRISLLMQIVVAAASIISFH